MPFDYLLKPPNKRAPYQPDDTEAPQIDTQMPDIFMPTSAPEVRPEDRNMNIASNDLFQALQPRQVSGKRRALAMILGGLGGPELGKAISGYSGQQEDIKSAKGLFDLANAQQTASRLQQKSESDMQHDRALEQQYNTLKNNPTDKFLYHELDENQEDHAVFQGTNGQMYTVKVPGFKGPEKTAAATGGLEAQGYAAALKKNPNLTIEQYHKQYADSGRAPAGSGPEPGSYIPLTDAQGNVIGAWNPKSDEFKGIPEQGKGARRSGLSETALQQRSNLDVMLEDAASVETIAPRHRSSIGPVDAVGGWLASKTIGNDPEVAEMRRAVGDMSDALLRARSGAQINEQEYGRLAALVPQVNDPESNFFTKLASFKKQLQLIKSSKPSAMPSDNAQPGMPPAGATMKVPGSDGKMHWSDGKRDLGVIQ